MYPVLFPYDIGGFEDKSRLTALSFQQHTQYLLNIPNCLFSYHQSFIFVALNIQQGQSPTKKVVTITDETDGDMEL